jgi:hypothetical protein
MHSRSRHVLMLNYESPWNQYTGTYPGVSRNDLAEESLESGFAVERAAFAKATSLSASSAQVEYPSCAAKMHVVFTWCKYA